jgi:hypothetical protein
VTQLPVVRVHVTVSKVFCNILLNSFFSLRDDPEIDEDADDDEHANDIGGDS